MYLKDKKTVTIGSMLIYKKFKDLLKVKETTPTGKFLVYSIVYGELSFYMNRDFTVRGHKNKILFRLELIKKIKYKRKRYKNG